MNLRTSIDVNIVGDKVYFLTMAGKKLFNMERAYKKLCADYVVAIKDSGIIVNVDGFTDVPVLYATWAYQKGGKQLESFGMDYDEMYQKMYDTYHEAADQNDALIADVGKCFYEEATKQDIFAEDGCHPNELGSKLAAQVIADVILSDQATKTEVVIEPKAEDNDTRLRILYLYQMLLTQTDEEHTLSEYSCTKKP